MGPIARGLAAPIRWYQKARAGRPSPCRFEPSCSSYALEALERHGALRGTAYAIRRIVRCNPFGGHGWDPVPHRDDPTIPSDHLHHERTIT